MFGTSKYNHVEFKQDQLPQTNRDNLFDGAPSPGDRAPNFELPTLHGDKVKLRAFRGKRNVVISFASATCPQTAASLPGLNRLAEDEKYEDVEFLLVYVREAFPGERIPAHKNIDQKRRAAALLRDAEHTQIPILIDNLDGKVHRSYGELPNATFIVDRSGRIAFNRW